MSIFVGLSLLLSAVPPEALNRAPETPLEAAPMPREESSAHAPSEEPRPPGEHAVLAEHDPEATMTAPAETNPNETNPNEPAPTPDSRDTGATTTSGDDSLAPQLTSGDGVDRRFVFAALAGINWAAVSTIPSGEITLFFGSTLRPRVDRRGRRWRAALGYEPTVSVGAADYNAAFLSFGAGYGRTYHRHHVSILGYGPRRLHYAVGGGPLFWSSTLTAFEAEGRLGAVFHARQGRIHGLIGVRARLVMILGGYPIPHLGLTAGVAVW